MKLIRPLLVILVALAVLAAAAAGLPRLSVTPGLDAFEEILGRLFAHPFQSGDFLEFETVQVSRVTHQARGYELTDQNFPAAFDVHGATESLAVVGQPYAGGIDNMETKVGSIEWRTYEGKPRELHCREESSLQNTFLNKSRYPDLPVAPWERSDPKITYIDFLERLDRN